MDEIRKAKLPGFYTDERGAYGVIVNGVYICCHVNMETGEYDVTADAVDGKGDFALNLDWESYADPAEAVERLRWMLKKYAKRS